MQKTIPFRSSLALMRKKLAARFPSQNQLNIYFADLQADTFDIFSGAIFTLTLTALVLAYLFARIPAWPGFGEFAGLYILFNFVLLLRFVILRALNAWTLDDLGHQLTALDKFVKDELLPRIS